MMTEEWPKVAIIVLNWNGWRDTIECLESLQRITYSNYQIIVVDNGSTDGSVERIKCWASGELEVESDYFTYDPTSKPVNIIEYNRALAETGGIIVQELSFAVLPSSRRLVIIQTGGNLGFAAGNNVAIRYALKREYELILLLNNDTIVHPLFLTKMVESLQRHPDWMAVSPKILYKKRPNIIWYAGGKLKLLQASAHHIGIGQHDSIFFVGERDTEHVTGCAFLARRDLFHKIGYLDEDFFFGHEDIALSCICKEKGQMLGVNLDAVVMHKAGGSCGTGDPIYSYFYNKNRLLILKKYASPAEQLLGFTWYVGTRFIKFPLLLLQGKKKQVFAEIKAIFDFLAEHYGDFDRMRGGINL
ncbi:glycosyltransferase family 2 protein [Methanothrix sp.]|uniref:glycosyltransferase family 2 protein n=1 Tax=Methanothrix sp. TaxID=90426 RepID=UPI003C7619BC